MEFFKVSNYVFSFLMMGVGLYIILSANHLIKKIIGLAVLQTSCLIFFISIAYVKGGQLPYVSKIASHIPYTNPLPHVLMLTAIVVGISMLALGLSLVIRIKEEYGTVYYSEILEKGGKE